MLHVANVCALV